MTAARNAPADFENRKADKMPPSPFAKKTGRGQSSPLADHARRSLDRLHADPEPLIVRPMQTVFGIFQEIAEFVRSLFSPY